MRSRGPLLPLAVIAVVAVVCALVESVAGLSTGCIFLAPALVLLLPLLVGRYLGEDALEHLAARAARRPRRRAATTVAPRARPATVATRGGRLLAASLGKRGPPRAAAVVA